jgi:hypothetical protein
LTPALPAGVSLVRSAEEIEMLSRIRSFWLGSVAALAVFAAALEVLAVPTSPARAQEWFGVRVGPFGFGFAEPHYYPYCHYYYPYGYRWGYPY